MKKPTVVCLAAVIVFTTVCPVSMAGLSSVDDPVFGVGSFTQDSSTGLEWLDLTRAAGRTRQYVTANLGPGGAYDGLRYALESEVLTLFVNAGIPDVPGTSPGNIAPAQALMNYIGSTSFQAGIGDGREAIAQLADGTAVRLDATFSSGVPMMVARAGGGYGFTYSTPSVGHWLVREGSVVPAPGAVLLASMGAGLVGWMRRRRAL